MSLSDLAFDVDAPLEVGQALVVLVEQPDGGAHERLVSAVRYCEKTGDGVYRVGVCVEAATTVGSDDPGQHVAFPVGPAMPVCAATPLFLTQYPAQRKTHEHTESHSLRRRRTGYPRRGQAGPGNGGRLHGKNL